MPMKKIIAIRAMGKEAIVRKTVLDGDSRVLAKYGLNGDGEWIVVAEGEPYPTECILPVTRIMQRTCKRCA